MTENDPDQQCGMPQAMLALGAVVLVLILFFVGVAVISGG